MEEVAPPRAYTRPKVRQLPGESEGRVAALAGLVRIAQVPQHPGRIIVAHDLGSAP